VIAAVAVEDWATCHALKAPVKRLCTAAVPIPYSPAMEDFVLPDAARIVAAVRETLAF
jgi:pyruvate dehydrogenase E1 component beta subunit